MIEETPQFMPQRVIQNVRPPDERAARLARRLLVAGMSAQQSARYSTGADDAVHLEATCISLGVSCDSETARHAIDEWRACYEAMPDSFRAQVRKVVGGA